MVRADPSWPAPADPAAAARLTESFAALGVAESRFAAQPRGAEILASLGGNSPYLSALALREPAVLRAFHTDGPDRCFGRSLERLSAQSRRARPGTLPVVLRRAKRQVALLVALADLAGAWPLALVTAALSRFAEEALTLAVDHLLLRAAEQGRLHVPDPAQPAAGAGFVVLGMGKLGAGELNYSSDIDLVLLYDPAPQLAGGIDAAELGASFARLARSLVALMQERDAEGYVFRTDLRLRPDPGATPPAISLPAALTYYESMAQNWERAAMVKARPVAGDLAVGHAFLDAIRPFIWRRGLDFAAVADIAVMKRRIEAQHGPRPAADPVQAACGFNLKLGRGGIRAIEFLVQTLQLVWGGRDPTLRSPQTLAALKALARAGHITRAAAKDLTRSYQFLRQLEHRLQMVADRQTHSLPDQPDALAAFAIFAGFPDAPSLAVPLHAVLDGVHRHGARLFGQMPDSGPGTDAAPIYDFSGPEPDPALAAHLASLGFQNPDALFEAVRSWRSGRVRALRSERAQLLMAELLPHLLPALAGQPQPDLAFARFDQLVDRLPAGVALLSLLSRNPPLLGRIATMLGAAPFLAEHLARNPAALDGLLQPAREPAPGPLLRDRLRAAATLEEAVGILRRTRVEADFSFSVATLEGRLDANSAGRARTRLAEAVVRALLDRVMAVHVARFGRVPGGAVAVVGLGKLGSAEMMAGSDLDLMLIYDHPPASTESRPGPQGRAVAASHYYARFAQSFVAALTAPGAEGPTFPVDMRLRPSGSAGPVAVSLGAFRRYHREQAWTWERMAITRARVIAGPALLAARVTDALSTIIDYAGQSPSLAQDAASMRARLLRERRARGPFDVKFRDGGLIEVEFIAQTLQLLHAGRNPGIAHPTTRDALARLGAAGLLPAETATRLIAADFLWRTLLGLLRVTVGEISDPRLPDASAAVLVRALAGQGVRNQDDLHHLMAETATMVRAEFCRWVGPPVATMTETAR